MKIAVPVAEGVLCAHFGHCQNFELVDVDPDKKEITGRQTVVPPMHQPGVLPPWLADQGVQLVIAGGMGQRAVQIFQQSGIRVIIGASCDPPEKLVKDWLNGQLMTGDNLCDH